MKKIFVLGLLSVFLTANYAYATFPIEDLSDKMEVHYEREALVQEQVEALFAEFFIAQQETDPGPFEEYPGLQFIVTMTILMIVLLNLDTIIAGGVYLVTAIAQAIVLGLMVIGQVLLYGAIFVVQSIAIVWMFMWALAAAMVCVDNPYLC